MGLWATVKKVMASKFFADTLENGDYKVKNSVNSTFASRAVSGEGKKFTFSNLGGFGIYGAANDSNFFVWNRNTQGDDNYYCCLVPSEDGVQDFGFSSNSLYRVYSKKFITTDVTLPGDNINDKKVPENGLYYGEWIDGTERLCIGMFFWSVNAKPIYIPTGGFFLSDTVYTTIIDRHGFLTLKRLRNESVVDVTEDYDLFLRRV